MRFSKIGSSASGVTSRPVKPVPPVVITTSIASSLRPGENVFADLFACRR